MVTWLSLAGAGALAVWYRHRRRIVVPCSMDLEATHDHFHAHVALEGVNVAPGDAVRVHDAPSAIAFGEVRAIASRAEVQQASWPRRQWTRLTGRFGVSDLYDVGFE